MSLYAVSVCASALGGRDRVHALAGRLVVAWLLATLLAGSIAWAHDVGGEERSFLETLTGAHPFPYLYLGAKHMVTGYDHLLYLLGVVFFLSRGKDVVLFVSLFAIGHSVTLISGVLAGVGVDARLIDALIGLSVAYKAIENLGGFLLLSEHWVDPRWAVFGFGLIHGLGLATKLQDIAVGEDGLLTNLLAFNVGVELGQALALVCLLTLIGLVRVLGFKGHPAWPNVALMSAGFLLFALHGYGFLVDS